MEPDCKTIEEAIRELDKISPDAPLLALGQTVLWDEPMKAGVAAVARPAGRKFVAGVHDTDYFAKLPVGPREPGMFRAFPHNATTTKGLWSAAGEFSAIFGSETVIGRQDFLAAGLKLDRILRDRPTLLDEASEAYGWRGIVSLDDSPPLAMAVPLRAVFEPLQKTLDWAVGQTLEAAVEGDRRAADAEADELWKRICKSFENCEDGTLSDFYEDLLPAMYEWAGGAPPSETTRTSRLLQFNRETCRLPRFALVEKFLETSSGGAARRAYNDAVAGSEIYTLDRFGTGAIPFDLVIPGIGRGTLRIGRRGLIVATPEPVFASYKQPVDSLERLAAVIEDRFGPDCALIGKAVTLIGMLANEFVFVFHEGASGYVKHSRRFHAELSAAGLGLPWNPILRVRYQPWDALEATCLWLRLPKVMQQPFGVEEICGPSFAARWRTVAQEQRVVLAALGELRRPVDLIRFLDEHVGGAWSALAREYESLHDSLDDLIREMRELKAKRRAGLNQLRELRAARAEAERRKGIHFREAIYERTPESAVWEERERLAGEVAAATAQIGAVREEIGAVQAEQDRLARHPEILRIHERRRAIELEAELQRMQLIRRAVICSTGLTRAGQRPSAWWFRLLSPDRRWIEATWRRAMCYFEPLSTATGSG